MLDEAGGPTAGPYPLVRLYIQVEALNKFQAETFDPGHQCFAAPETLAGVWTQVFHAHPNQPKSP